MSEKKQYPTPEEFLINFPMYEFVHYDDDSLVKGQELVNFDQTIDTYCPKCNNHSIFRRHNFTRCNSPDGWINYGKFSIELSCSRVHSHKLFFLFYVENKTIQKIGQFPSLADLNLYDVQKYSKVLDKKYFQELTKAIGLVSHGIGVGSFVYLRRIFESLINDSYLEAKTKDGWDDEQYSKSRMAEKIDLLKNELPNFLVKNKSMYGILSKGVHELSENECLEAFSIVKIGIELILDEKLEKMNKDKKLIEAKKAISSLAGKIN